MSENLAVYDSGNSGLVEKDNQVPMITNNFEDELNKMISMAGTIELTEAQKAILYAPVDDDLIEIRPDGMIYLPWMEYVSRLKQTFGLSWQAIPQGMPKFQGNHIFWGYYLVIGGKFAGFAIGEQEYQVKNYGMSYGDAVEGAKSNALMRLCKGVGICLELWQPSFIKRWKAKYAETYYDKKKDKTLWKRKDGGDVSIEKVSEPSPSEAEAKDKAKNAVLDKLMNEITAIVTIEELEKKYATNKAKYESSEMKESIIKLFGSRKAQLTLELIASKTGFSAYQVDSYMGQAGEIGSLVAEIVAGNVAAVEQLTGQIVAFLKVPVDREPGEEG